MMFSFASVPILLVSLIVSLLVWRIWRFTLTPYLYPNKPREFPYWTPFIGHAVGFFWDLNDVLERARIYFDNSKEPYAVTVAGQTIYMITSPDDVAVVYKGGSWVTWDKMIVEMYAFMDISQSTMRVLFGPPLEGKKSTNEKSGDIFNHQIVGLHAKQLHGGREHTLELENNILSGIDRKLDLHPPKNTISNSEDPDQSFTVSLYDLCNKTINEVLVEGYFGKAIWKVHPHVVKNLLEWEERSWKLLFGLPRLMAQDAIKIRNDFMSGFEAWYALPRSERSDSAFQFNALETLLTEAGFNRRDMSAVTMLHVWAILGNVSKLSFWLIAHLAYDTALLHKIRSEVMATITNGQIDHDRLDKKCPNLDSVYFESLRHIVSAALPRDVIETVRLGNKVLEKGHRLLLPFHQLHRNRDVWGSSPELFQAGRFKEDARLTRSKSLRPFGGGETLCPGRFLARKMAFTFVATLLLRYDVGLDNPESDFPRASTQMGPGAASPMEGDDVILRLRRNGPMNTIQTD